MPPKGSKGTKKRSHPYDGPRQSARIASAAASQGEAQSQVEAVNLQQDVQVNPNSLIEPQPSTSQVQSHTRAPPQQQPTPSTSSSQQPIQAQPTSSNFPMPQPIQADQQPPVTRREFDDLRNNMSSIKDMFTNFMASYVPPVNQVPPQRGAGNVEPSSLFSQPASVPVPNVVVNQPGPSHDHNIPSTSGASNATQDMASSVLEQAVAAHIKAITQGQATGKPQGERVSYQLDRKIPQSIVQDIWDDKFVDLELLIENHEDPDTPIVLKPINNYQEGQVIQVVKPKKPKTITNITQWSYAFDIYISVYTRKFYHETHNLLTYSNKVKQVHSKGGDFLKYDEEFRKSRAKYGTAWETPDLELLVECNQAGLQSQIINIINSLSKNPNFNLPFQDTVPSEMQRDDKPRHPSGACYIYHNTGRCGRVRCNFSHLCYNTGCGQEHPVFRCTKSPSSSSSKPSPYPGPGARPGGATGNQPNPTHPNTTK